jgi:hypothetical protein
VRRFLAIIEAGQQPVAGPKAVMYSGIVSSRRSGPLRLDSIDKSLIRIIVVLHLVSYIYYGFLSTRATAPPSSAASAPGGHRIRKK